MRFNLIKLTLTQLFQYGIHVGHPKTFSHRQLKPYLVGFKGKFTIFNLKHSKLQLKLVCHAITSLISLRQKILAVNHYSEMGNQLSLLDYRRIFFLEGSWLGGALTNYKKIRLYTRYFTAVQPQLAGLTSLPALTLFLNTTVDNWGLKESLSLNIPSAVVTGSTFPLINKVFYPLTCSGETQDSLLFYTHLIGRAAKQGLLKEYSTILKF